MSEILIFDMDGTLYQHDGINGTFKNSSLNNAVLVNSEKFVMNQENCDSKTAKTLVAEALVTDTIGISNFMAKRYGITRGSFFDIVWNINPKSVIKNFDIQAEIVKKLSKTDKKLFLLTGAPRVWMENALEFLELSDLFERKFNGEMFETKSEVFQKLADEFDPTSIISIGDQLESDILPAEKFGIKTLHIKKPEDLLKLI